LVKDAYIGSPFRSVLLQYSAQIFQVFVKKKNTEPVQWYRKKEYFRRRLSILSAEEKQ